MVVFPEYDLCKDNTLALSSSVLGNRHRVKVVYYKNFSKVPYKAEVYYLLTPQETFEKILEVESSNLNYLVHSVNLCLSLS